MRLSDPPEVAPWLRIPDNCRMRSEFELGDHALPDIHIILGSNGDDKHLLFEREALERLVTLAQRMLTIPVNPDSPVPQTRLESYRPPGRVVSNGPFGTVAVA